MGRMKFDVEVVSHGSLVSLKPRTKAGIEWVDEHLPADHLKFGGAVMVEWRFASDIVDGLVQDGLNVKVDGLGVD